MKEIFKRKTMGITKGGFFGQAQENKHFRGLGALGQDVGKSGALGNLDFEDAKGRELSYVR